MRSLFIVNKSGYKRAKRLYNSKVGIPICFVRDYEAINDFLLVPPDSNWRKHNDRILIFRPGYKIASFVITPSRVYCPLAVCCEQCGIDDDSYLVYKTVYHKTYYWKDMKTYYYKIKYEQSLEIINFQDDLKHNSIWHVIPD